MHSAVTSVGVAAVMFGIALYKGRTGWHWFALSLFAFAAIWLFSIIVLYAANVQISLAVADKSLAGFAGAVTCTVIFVLLVCVPYRPKKQPPAVGAMRGDPSP